MIIAAWLVWLMSSGGPIAGPPAPPDPVVLFHDVDLGQCVSGNFEQIEIDGNDLRIIRFPPVYGAQKIARAHVRLGDQEAGELRELRDSAKSAAPYIQSPYSDATGDISCVSRIWIGDDLIAQWTGMAPFGAPAPLIRLHTQLLKILHAHPPH
jgi:hypothetical protein